MEDYLEGRENLKMVFMLVDFRHKPTEDDVMMYKYLKHYNIPVSVICTKLDKISKNAVMKNKAIVMNTLGMEDEPILFSAITKEGKQEVSNKIVEYAINR